MTLDRTPGQTIGPFFGYSLPYDGDSELVPPGHPDAVRLSGLVSDGAGDPVPDALVELWQTGPAGDVVQETGSLLRDGFTFTGWGRAATDRDGRYTFSTLTPGVPFFALSVFARGLLDVLFTRAYLPSAADAAFLQGIDAERRDTLLAAADERGYVFDIRLQGPRETVFLDHPRH